MKIEDVKVGMKVKSNYRYPHDPDNFTGVVTKVERSKVWITHETGSFTGEDLWSFPDQFEPIEEETQKAHMHKDLIVAWANAAEIEFYNDYDSRWIAIEHPTWRVDTKYRIKPKPEPVTYRIGQRFVTSDYPCQWILAQVDARKICLIRLDEGNRFNDTVDVSSSMKITEEEFAQITQRMRGAPPFTLVPESEYK